MGRVEDFRFPQIDMEETGKYIRQISRDKDVFVKVWRSSNSSLDKMHLKWYGSNHRNESR